MTSPPARRPTDDVDVDVDERKAPRPADPVLRADGPPGIALHVFETAAPYLCRDTSTDPYYTRYLLDVGSMAAVLLARLRANADIVTR